MISNTLSQGKGGPNDTDSNESETKPLINITSNALQDPLSINASGPLLDQYVLLIISTTPFVMILSF